MSSRSKESKDGGARGRDALSLSRTGCLGGGGDNSTISRTDTFCTANTNTVNNDNYSANINTGHPVTLAVPEAVKPHGHNSHAEAVLQLDGQTMYGQDGRSISRNDSSSAMGMGMDM